MMINCPSVTFRGNRNDKTFKIKLQKHQHESVRGLQEGTGKKKYQLEQHLALLNVI